MDPESVTVLLWAVGIAVALLGLFIVVLGISALPATALPAISVALAAWVLSWAFQWVPGTLTRMLIADVVLVCFAWPFVAMVYAMVIDSVEHRAFYRRARSCRHTWTWDSERFESVCSVCQIGRKWVEAQQRPTPPAAPNQVGLGYVLWSFYDVLIAQPARKVFAWMR